MVIATIAAILILVLILNLDPDPHHRPAVAVIRGAGQQQQQRCRSRFAASLRGFYGGAAAKAVTQTNNNFLLFSLPTNRQSQINKYQYKDNDKDKDNAYLYYKTA